MSYVVAVIAPGAMGSALGKRLFENGVEVRTSLKGRSDAARARAQASGMDDVEDTQIACSDVSLSVVPPSEALALARRLAPALERAARKPVFVDCNAVSPQSTISVGDVITATGTPFVDGSIIGFPPQPGAPSPAIYMSGPHAHTTLDLARFGLDVRILDAPTGAASALKMSYAGITKGVAGLAAAMILSASRAGAGPALREELEKSQPELLKRFMKYLPDMFPKSYRWVAEMQEIVQFASGDSATQAIYSGLASLFERLAQDYGNDQVEVNVVDAFLNPHNVERPQDDAS